MSVGVGRDAIAPRDGALLIEGVGGVMAPLDARHTVLDWMAALDIPLVLVAGSYLGTISHTLTALDSLYRRDMNVLAIIVSETPGSTVPLDDTVAAIARFADPVIGLPRPRREGGDANAGAPLGRIFGPQGGPAPRRAEQGGPARGPRPPGSAR